MLKSVLSALGGLALTGLALAQPQAPLALSETLATLGKAAVTVADVDAIFHRLPPEVAEKWDARPGLIGDEMTNLLLRRAVAIDVLAEESGLLENADAIAAAARDDRLVELWMNARLLEVVEAVTDEDIRAYYEAHIDDFLSPRRVDVRQLFVSAEYRSEAAAMAELQAIHDEITTGERSFDEVYAELAEADQMPYRGAAPVSDLVPGQRNVDASFAAAAHALTEPGQLSPVIQSEFGFHLIALDAVAPAKPLAFVRVVAQAREALLRERILAERERLMASLGDDIAAVAAALRAHGFDDDPRVAASAAQAGESAVVTAYRERVMADEAKAAIPLARERYMINADAYATSDIIQYRMITIEQDALEAERMDALADAFLTSALGDDLRDFFHDHVGSDAEYRPNRGLIELDELSDEYRDAIAGDLTGEPPIHKVLTIGNARVFFQVVAWEPGYRPTFEEVREQVEAEVGDGVAKQGWRLVLARYHQLQLDADPERISLLHQRYQEGIEPLETPDLAGL